MRTFLRMISAECLKIAGFRTWLLILLSPLVSLPIGELSDMPGNQTITWQVLLSTMSTLHALLFLPVLSGLFAALICRNEHSDGGWKQLLALPVTRTSVYFAKYVLIIGLLGAVQLLFVGGVLGNRMVSGRRRGVPWGLLLSSLFGGWFACLPLAALQLAVSQGWSSFGAPLALNVCFTIPNILIANSATYGPYYPWVQPMLAMSPFGEERFGAFNLPLESLMIVVSGSLLLFLGAGLIAFWRKAV